MPVDDDFFDDIFQGGTITEERIDAACTRLMKLAQSNKEGRPSAKGHTSARNR
jgi:hypothetical protein